MQPLATALDAHGWDTFVVDNRAAGESPSTFVAAAAEQIPWRDAVLVGHSGAGAFLPTLAEQCSVAASVFVDAVLPPADSAFVPSAGFLAFVDALPTADGRLSSWDQWWPSGTLEALIPDDSVRAALVSEFPRLRRSFYDEPVPVAVGWTGRPCAYIRLSAAYAEECARATDLGWPVRQLDGRHLDLVAHPSIVAAHVVDSIRDLGSIA